MRKLYVSWLARRAFHALHWYTTTLVPTTKEHDECVVVLDQLRKAI